MSGLRDQVAIVGVGYAVLEELRRHHPHARAARHRGGARGRRARACGRRRDRDLPRRGLGAPDGRGAEPRDPGSALPPRSVRGGSVSHAIVGQAALALHAGVADTIVVYRALNARSGFRMGGTGRPPVDAVETQYQAPYGYFTPPQQFAMAARAHMARYGTQPEHFGRIAVAQRAFARDNERAMMREPMTLEDYLASRHVVEPFRLFDCCLETDGAVALVLTRAERARDLAQTPVLIRAAAWGGGQTLYSNDILDTTRTSAADMAPRLYAMAGVGPSDFDLAELYDCFTYSVLVQLEDYGFCPKGEGGPFVASGATARGGAIPVNTHGGFLSEGYVHGLNHVAEAVSQLRHTAGLRQVPGAELALSTAQPGYVAGSTAALVLRRGNSHE